MSKESPSVNTEKVIAAIQENPGGITTKSICDITGLSTQHVVNILTKLVRVNRVVRIERKYDCMLWILPSEKWEAPVEEIPYPNLDKDHEEWRKEVLKKKPVYNPR
jgi:hypothetical protein